VNCQLCGATELVEILDLGNQPICNAVLTTQQLTKLESVYPLKVYVCTKCFLMQLDGSVPKETVFNKNYNYLTGSSPELIEYFQNLASKIINSLGLGEKDLVIDIGCNDGTFLEGFKNKGIAVLGIEPTPFPAQVCRSKGISVIERFFNGFQLAHTKMNLFMHDSLKVISAMNVLAHVDDIHAFLEDVRGLMQDDSVFISQSHYLPALIEKLEYDTIYHEHLRYYTLTTLKHLFELHDLYIYDATVNDVYGGSILIYASTIKNSSTFNLNSILESEEKYGKLETYIEFANQTRQNAEKLVSYLKKLKDKGKRIVGVGAPMKASTLLNFCGVGTETLDYIAELNPLKIGTYTPGTHIPIMHESTVATDLPDYALILSWNFADTIMAKWRRRGYKGGFIIPVPEFHVVNEVTEVKDKRGVITDVLTDEQIEHINHITFKKGAVRGNHYHKKSIHYDYILKGEIEVYRRYPWEPVKKQIAVPGDLIFTGPNERHALKALRNSEIMVFTRGPRGGKNYECDTYRLSEKETLA